MDVTESTDPGGRQMQADVSLLLTVETWAIHITSLRFYVSICKMELFAWIKRNSADKVFTTIPGT